MFEFGPVQIDGFADWIGKIKMRESTDRTRFENAHRGAGKSTSSPHLAINSLAHPRTLECKYRAATCQRERRPKAHLHDDGGRSGHLPQGPVTATRVFGKFSAKDRSFSALSAPIFASTYAFCSIFQNLPDYLLLLADIFTANFHKLCNTCKMFTENC